MNEPNTPLARVPRDSLASRIWSLGLAKAKSYATFIREGDKGGPTPCWGAIAARFVESFPTDEERLVVLDKLIEEGDPRPLYLFLETSRARPKLLASLCERAGELPVSVQRNLVAMPEVVTYVAATLDRFDPSAQLVWTSGEDVKRRECELLSSRVGELMSLQYFVPDHVAPHKESSRLQTATSATATGTQPVAQPVAIPASRV